MTGILEVARKMRGPEGTAKVLVLDVGYSANKYRVGLAATATRHAYYLLPPPGMEANDLKAIIDEAGGELQFEFRYFAYPELDTDLKPLLTADPYAAKHFGNNREHKLLKLEGERPKARENIAELIEGLKDPFESKSFPRLDEFDLISYTPSSDGRRDEIVLRRNDEERDEARKAEPGFNVAIAEHGFATEIDVYRPTVNESDPVLIFYSTALTTVQGHKFLADLAAYLKSATHVQRSAQAKRELQERRKEEAAAPVSTFTPHFQSTTVQTLRLDERQLVVKVAQGIKELLPNMKLLQKRQVSQSGPYVTIQFPGGLLGMGKGPSEKEIKELEGIYRALKGDPSFGSDWSIRYQVDKATGELKLSPTQSPTPLPGWTPLGH